MIPVRCFGCGRLLGHFERRYRELLQQEGGRPGAHRRAMLALGLRRGCCFTDLRTSVSVIDDIFDFERSNEVRSPFDTSSTLITVHKQGRPNAQPPASMDAAMTGRGGLLCPPSEPAAAAGIAVPGETASAEPPSADAAQGDAKRARTAPHGRWLRAV